MWFVCGLDWVALLSMVRIKVAGLSSVVTPVRCMVVGVTCKRPQGVYSASDTPKVSVGELSSSVAGSKVRLS